MSLTDLPALAFSLQIAMGALGLCLLACALRLWRGPSLPDRIMALDAAYLYALALVVLLGIQRGSQLFFEVALLIALLGFVSTIAAARYLARGDVIE